jgi:hypothetical protein
MPVSWATIHSFFMIGANFLASRQNDVHGTKTNVGSA